MKTYIISTSPFGNSIPNHFFELSKNLIAKGNRVVIVFDKNHNPANSNTGIIYKTWPSTRPTKLKDFIFYYKLCREYNPEIVLGQFGSTNITLLVGSLLRIPNRIIYWHTMFIQLKIDSTQSKITSKLRHWFKKNLLQHFSTLILTNSSATKNDLISHYQLTNIRVLNYLIPDPKEAEKIKSKKERDFAISFVGRLDKSKGQENLINVLPQIISIYPNLIIYFVGDGTEKKRLELRCIELKIQKNVCFTGSVSLNEVYDYMAKSLVHISMSAGEAFGLVNAEALAVGTPILANKVGGIEDILLEGQNGYSLDLEKEGDVIGKLKKIIEGDWSTFSKKARKHFEDNFLTSQKNLTRQLNELEKELLPTDGNSH